MIQIIQTEKLLSAHQVAEIIGIQYSSVYSLLKRGEIKASKIGSLWKIPESSLIEFLKNRGLSNILSPRCDRNKED